MKVRPFSYLAFLLSILRINAGVFTLHWQEDAHLWRGGEDERSVHNCAVVALLVAKQSDAVSKHVFDVQRVHDRRKLMCPSRNAIRASSAKLRLSSDGAPRGPSCDDRAGCFSGPVPVWQVLQMRILSDPSLLSTGLYT